MLSIGINSYFKLKATENTTLFPKKSAKPIPNLERSKNIFAKFLQ